MSIYLGVIVTLLLQISYPNAIVLMEHLQHMGEGNASLNRQFAVGADTFLATAALYQGEGGRRDDVLPTLFLYLFC